MGVAGWMSSCLTTGLVLAAQRSHLAQYGTSFFFPLQVIDVRVCRSGVSDAEASLRKPADDQFKILLAHLVLVLFFYYLVLSA
jgi:hypothetical protein